METLIKHIANAIFAVIAAGFAALGLGILHVDLPFGTRWLGCLAILAALVINSAREGD